ncbi:hypothetical protein CHOED_055 [Vibrio phage CHOED]|uniref:hypothetical protein n=1 Tax=Vibrio phage CHOED TaxID=1458716 RepID=UPI00042E9867|nr:hypothetical protein CHOED_055 [Vibrio phage CHOED]AHK11915.1 putative membrane protein [Vibrio phage CHOED]
MIKILAIALLLNMVVFPLLVIGEGLYRLAMNQPLGYDETFWASKYQAAKYLWALELSGDEDNWTDFELWMLDLGLGFVLLMALAFLGYWVVGAVTVLGIAVAIRKYNQHRGK